MHRKALEAIVRANAYKESELGFDQTRAKHSVAEMRVLLRSLLSRAAGAPSDTATEPGSRSEGIYTIRDAIYEASVPSCIIMANVRGHQFVLVGKSIAVLGALVAQSRVHIQSFEQIQGLLLRQEASRSAGVAGFFALPADAASDDLYWEVHSLSEAESGGVCLGQLTMNRFDGVIRSGATRVITDSALNINVKRVEQEWENVACTCIESESSEGTECASTDTEERFRQRATSLMDLWPCDGCTALQYKLTGQCQLHKAEVAALESKARAADKAAIIAEEGASVARKTAENEAVAARNALAISKREMEALSAFATRSKGEAAQAKARVSELHNRIVQEKGKCSEQEKTSLEKLKRANLMAVNIATSQHAASSKAHAATLSVLTRALEEQDADTEQRLWTAVPSKDADVDLDRVLAELHDARRRLRRRALEGFGRVFKERVRVAKAVEHFRDTGDATAAFLQLVPFSDMRTYATQLVASTAARTTDSAAQTEHHPHTIDDHKKEVEPKGSGVASDALTQGDDGIDGGAVEQLAHSGRSSLDATCTSFDKMVACARMLSRRVNQLENKLLKSQSGEGSTDGCCDVAPLALEEHAECGRWSKQKERRRTPSGEAHGVALQLLPQSGSHDSLHYTVACASYNPFAYGPPHAAPPPSHHLPPKSPPHPPHHAPYYAPHHPSHFAPHPPPHPLPHPLPHLPPHLPPHHLSQQHAYCSWPPRT